MYLKFGENFKPLKYIIQLDYENIRRKDQAGQKLAIRITSFPIIGVTFSLVLCFIDALLKCYLNDREMVPVSPIIIGINFVSKLI
jgi:hypothetical protein